MEKVKGWKTKVIRDWLQNNKENVTVAGVHKELAKKHGDEISLSLVATCFRRLAFFPGAYKIFQVFMALARCGISHPFLLDFFLRR